MVLESYSSLLSFIASSATLPLLLSPSLICRDFIKKGSADHLKPFVFVQGLIRSSMFIQFGISSGLTSVMRVHSVGLTLYIIYFTLYYKYCSNKRPATIAVLKAIAFIVSVLGYVNCQPESLLAIYFPTITTIIHLSLLGLPLLNMKEVIRKKSSAGMPFPILLCATVVSVSWLLFGISINNRGFIIQMLVGSILAGTQLSLCFIYPAKEDKEKIKKKN